MSKVLQVDAALADSWVEQDLGADQSDIWITATLRIPAAALALFTAPGNSSGYFTQTWDPGHATFTDYVAADENGWQSGWATDGTPAPSADAWLTLELHHVNGGAADVYIDGTLVLTGTDGLNLDTRFVTLGLISGTEDPLASVVYVDDVKIGTSRGASDLFADDFESGDLSAWTSTSGEVYVIDDPFTPPTPPVGKVLKADGSSNESFVEQDLGSDQADVWVSLKVLLPAASVAADASVFTTLLELVASDDLSLADNLGLNSSSAWSSLIGDDITPAATDSFQAVEFHHVVGGTCKVYVGGIPIISGADPSGLAMRFLRVGYSDNATIDGSIYYFDDVKVGTTRGGSDLFSDDFESGDLSAWTSAIGDVSVVDYPLVTVFVAQRVGIAWDDGPLEPDPTWTFLDDGITFPENFVSGYDIAVGRQTLLAQTDTGTATVYINDRAGLLDDRNDDSPYQGKLSGRQILLQLYDPVQEVWEPQFRGLINSYTYDIDGSAVDANGDPINASIQIECVDMFDYLAGYGLTPGLDGVYPLGTPGGSPAGGEDGVWYAATSGSVDDRIIEILTDVGIDSTRWIVASGNTKVIAVKYDPDESALQALRDACDAEIPFIANMYVNRHGQFVFRGRYSRFDPDAVAAEPMSEWDFTRWPMGDGKAILAASLDGEGRATVAQIRVLSYTRDRDDLINDAICYPQGLEPSDMPNQFFANAPSITAYGKHSAPPMSDLLTGDYTGPGTLSPGDGKQQCAMFAELLVKNKKDPRIDISELQLKSIDTTDFRASAVWDTITRSDISHVARVTVGYPGGTGLTGGATQDDYYIEGRRMTVRPTGTTYDSVELDLDVTPAIWSMDTHEVFPAFGS